MKLGIDCINDYLGFFKGKRVGLITNPTGMDSEYRSTIDVLNEKTNLVALFSPEHGIRGNIQAGEKLTTYTDEKTGCTVYSLYGETRRPTEEMMKDIDVLCIEGNILDLKYRSFVGYYPILQRYGLTMGEAAYLFNEEYEIGCKLKIIQMQGYDRNMYWEDTKKLWIAPSPNIPTPDSAMVYNCTCVFEGTNLSEGRGTTAPFEIVGAPWIDPYEYSQILNDMKFEGVYFRPMFFTPTFSKNSGKMCGGVFLHITDREKFQAVKVGWAMLDVVRKMYPNDFQVNKPYVEGRPCMLEYETGGSFIKDMTYTLEEQFEIIDRDTKEFGKIREKYLLY